jgi:hypothetical protein
MRQVAQHIRRCDRCRKTGQAFVSPAEVLGGLERIAPVNGLRREIFKPASRRRLLGSA